VTALRLGSRGSQLALFQARLVAQRIVESGAPAPLITIIKTSGDQLADRPLSEIGGKRLFVKEIEDALLRNEIDIAVHSSKDMPAELPAGLAIAAALPREDPADALVLPLQFTQTVKMGSDPLFTIREHLRAEARIGTGSVRRIAQLTRLFPGASFQNIRGNLDTRLRKVDEGGYDMLVLAAAGLRRLGFSSRISMRVPLQDCIPAPGQGIIAIETRDDDRLTRAAVAGLNDADAAAALEAERALVTALGGGCQMPIGGVAVLTSALDLELHAIVASLDGSRAIRYNKVGPRSDAAALGRQVAEYLLRAGANKLLEEAGQAGSPIANP
jgi:hydroxymethylbilane synthase